MMRALLNIDEFRAMAFIRSSFPTMSTINAWRVGMSNAFTIPRHEASTKTCQTCTCPDRVRNDSASARSIDALWVAITTRCRLWRSATAPPNEASRNTGSWLQNPTVPSSNDEPVRR